MSTTELQGRIPLSATLSVKETKSKMYYYYYYCGKYVTKCVTGFEGHLYMLRENTRRQEMICGGEFLYIFLKFVLSLWVLHFLIT